GVKGVHPGARQVVRELLDPGLVGDRGEGVGRARRRFGRVLAAGAVDRVELLGLGVVGLHLLIGDRPRRGDPSLVAELTEVLFAQAIERGPVHLGGAAYEVVNFRLEGLAARVIPSIRRDVAVIHEHLGRVPVLWLAREPVAALEQEDALARGCEVAREGAPACPRPDDDHIEVAHPLISSSRSATMIRAAASTAARCEKAWGKFPGCRPVPAPNSSAYRPRGEATLTSFSIRSRARCSSPTIANAETSQKEQITKVPSFPDRPSSVSPVR